MPLCHLERPRDCSGSMPNIPAHYRQNVEEELKANTLEKICSYKKHPACEDWLPWKVHCTIAVKHFHSFKVLAAAWFLRRKIWQQLSALSALCIACGLKNWLFGGLFPFCSDRWLNGRLRSVFGFIFLPGMQNYCWICKPLLADPSTARRVCTLHLI